MSTGAGGQKEGAEETAVAGGQRVEVEEPKDGKATSSLAGSIARVAVRGGDSLWMATARHSHDGC